MQCIETDEALWSSAKVFDKWKENTLFGVLSQGKFGQIDLSCSVASENHSTKFWVWRNLGNLSKKLVSSYCSMDSKIGKNELMYQGGNLFYVRCLYKLVKWSRHMVRKIYPFRANSEIPPSTNCQYSHYEWNIEFLTISFNRSDGSNEAIDILEIQFECNYFLLRWHFSYL